MGYRLWGWTAILFLLVLLHGMTFLTLLVKDDTAYLILLGVFWLPALLWLCVGAITRIGIGDFYDRVMAGALPGSRVMHRQYHRHTSANT